jgi:hypothetical protein
MFTRPKVSLKSLAKGKVSLGAGFNTATAKCEVKFTLFGLQVKGGIKGHAGGISAKVKTNGIKHVDISVSFGVGGGFSWDID